MVPSPVHGEDVAFSFSAPPPSARVGPRAGDVSTMSLKGETELGGMKREAGRGLKGPEVLGGGGFRRGVCGRKESWVRVQQAREYRSGLGLSRALGASGSHAPPGSCPGPCVTP